MCLLYILAAIGVFTVFTFIGLFLPAGFGVFNIILIFFIGGILWGWFKESLRIHQNQQQNSSSNLNDNSNDEEK